MKKQHYTAEIPVSNPYNFAAFEDLIANIQSGYNEWVLPRPPGSQNFSGGKCPASAMAPGLHFRGPFPYSASPATDRVTTEKGIENKPVPETSGAGLSHIDCLPVIRSRAGHAARRPTASRRSGSRRP